MHKNVKPKQVSNKIYAHADRQIAVCPAVVLILCEMMHVTPPQSVLSVTHFGFASLADSSGM